MVNPEAIKPSRLETAQRGYFEVTLKKMCERHPKHEAYIRRSLEVPQLGAFHNEGEKMDSHLSLMLQVLRSIKKGKFHESLAQEEDLQKQIRSIVRTEVSGRRGGALNQAMVEYVFLHDIAKPDCIAVKARGEKKTVDITWEQWLEIEKGGKPYMYQGKEIVSISYFHNSEGPAGQHGNKAVEMLGSDEAISPNLIETIRNHEVAHQFPKINALTYKKHFVDPGYDDDQQLLIITASYVDTMASLKQDGEPDLRNFTNLVLSRKNYLLVQKSLAEGAMIRDNDLAFLLKQDRVLTDADVAAAALKANESKRNELQKVAAE